MSDANCERLVILLTALAVLATIAHGLPAQSPASSALSSLVQISAHEYLDPAKITYFRTGYTIDLSAFGGDANYPVSPLLIVGGQQAQPSPEGEARLKAMLVAGDK